MTRMKRMMMMGAVALAAMAPAAVHAGSPDGKVQVKVLGTAVLPDGYISAASGTAVGVLAGSNAKASDNYVPTVAVEYFLSPNLSIETICCLTSHHVTGTGALAGVDLVNNILILPATVTLKAHAQLGPIKPYVGVGPSMFLFLKKDPSTAVKNLGIARVEIPSQVGLALQGGVDIAINDQGMSLSLDAKRYFMRPTAKYFNAASTEVLRTHHELDPWVLSAGLAYRF